MGFLIQISNALSISFKADDYSSFSSEIFWINALLPSRAGAGIYNNTGPGKLLAGKKVD